MAGFIYIMSNQAYRTELVKIGKSERDPELFRKLELETTGVPEAFTVEYYAFVDDHDELERAIHRELRHLRRNKNREFFDISVPDAIVAIRAASPLMHYERVNYRSPEEILLAKREATERKATEKRLQETQEREEQRRAKSKSENAARTAILRVAHVNAKMSSNAWLASLFVILGIASLLLLAFLFGDGAIWAGFVLVGMWGSYYFIRQDAKTKYGKQFDDMDRSIFNRSGTNIQLPSNSKAEKRTAIVKCRTCNTKCRIKGPGIMRVTCPKCGDIWTVNISADSWVTPDSAICRCRPASNS